MFYTSNGWVEAEDLHAGDVIVSLGGVYGTVDSVIIENAVQKIYDLTVEEVHNFAVGDGDWVVHNCQDWQFPPAFPRKVTQATNRGWTNIDIQSVLDSPAETLAAPRGNLATGNSATIYYRSDGHYVILDDVTNDIVQVSDTNDAGWLDEGISNVGAIRTRP